MVLIWLNKAVKLLSILIKTLWTHRCSAFTKDLPVIKIRFAHLFSVCVLLLYVFTFWVPCCDFRIQTMVGSFFTSSCLQEGSCLINVMCVCLRIMVSNAHCVRFSLILFGFYSLSCVTCVANFYGLSIFCYHFSILYRLLTLAHLMLGKCHLVCIISQLWIKVGSIVILM